MSRNIKKQKNDILKPVLLFGMVLIFLLGVIVLNKMKIGLSDSNSKEIICITPPVLPDPSPNFDRTKGPLVLCNDPDCKSVGEPLPEFIVATELPEKFPADIPVYPNSTVRSTGISLGTKLVQFSTSSTSEEEIFDFYKQEAAANWKLMESSPKVISLCNEAQQISISTFIKPNGEVDYIVEYLDL